MINQTEVRVVELWDRVLDVHMRGTYGFVPEDLRAQGFVMLTESSMVYEFLVEKHEERPGVGQCLIGTDKYGRHLELPLDRIISITYKDTPEQGKLRSYNKLIRWIEEANAPGYQEHSIYLELKEWRDQLLAENPGLTEYEPIRVSGE